MKRFKSVLAMLDQDSPHEVALARAIHLAQTNEAKLTLVDVAVPHGGPFGATGVLAGMAMEQGERFDAAHLDRLAGAAETARAAGVDVREVLLEGTPFLEVIRLVLREDHDLVIKAAARPAGPRAWFQGTDMHLMRKCPCPVWVLKDADAGNFDRILACVDPGREDDPARAALDSLVLDLATSLGESEGAQVDVIHAWYLQEEQALRHSRATAGFTYEIDRIVQRDRETAEARVADLMAKYPQVPSDRVHILQGPPGEVIANYANRAGSDLIVMGTVARTGIAGFIMGNTAETILGQVSASVMAVKPPGFETPVAPAS